MIGLKTRIISLTMVSMLTISTLIIPAAAKSDVQPQTLTLDNCIKMAIDNTYDIKKLDNTLKDLWKQEDKLMASSNSIQDMLDKLENYRKLYDMRKNGKVLTISEQNDLNMYSYMFGEIPPNFSNEDFYNQYIKPRDFPHYSVWASYQNTKTNQDALKLTLQDQTRQLFDAILQQKDALTIQQNSLKTMAKQYELQQKKYERGLVSEFDRYQAEITLNKQRLSLDNQLRTYQNTVMMLKKTCGIPFSQEIILQPYVNSKIPAKLSYQDYLNNALKNRNEMLIARLNLQVKQREFDIMKKYITNTLSEIYLQSQQELNDCSFALKQATDDVTQDISDMYMDVESKEKSYQIAVSTFNNAQIDYNITEKQYTLGQVDMLTLWNKETALDRAQIGLTKAKSDWDYSLYKIKLGSGLGVQKMQGGSN